MGTVRQILALILTLSLVALSESRVRANHEVVILTAVVAGAAAGAVVWLLSRESDDPPDPSPPDSTETSRSGQWRPWRPTPAAVEAVLDEAFGVRFRSETAFGARASSCRAGDLVGPPLPACDRRDAR